MNTLSRSRNQTTVISAVEFDQLFVRRLNNELNDELSARKVASSENVLCFLERNPVPHAKINGIGVAVNLALPDITVSPVLNHPASVCVSCYRSRLSQHSTDPRVEHATLCPIWLPEGSVYPIPRPAEKIVVMLVASAIEEYVNKEPATYRAYRLSRNQISSGEIHSLEHCLECAESEEERT